MDNNRRRFKGENCRRYQRGGSSGSGHGQRSENWQPARRQSDQDPSYTVPAWEKKFCSKVGAVPWYKVVDIKKVTYLHGNIFKWNDSAGEEAFNNAKARFWAQINGLPCDIQSPDPDIYIDEIDWNSYVDPELISDLETEISNATIPYKLTPEKDEDSVVILGLHKITEEPPSCQAIFGWGDAGSNKLPEGETGNQATDNNYGRAIPRHDQVLQDNQGGWGWGNDWNNVLGNQGGWGWGDGWNNVQDHQVGWGWGSGWNNVQDNQGGWGWYNGWNNDNRYHQPPRQGNNRCQPVNNERGGRWESSMPRDSDGVWINHNKNHGCNIGSAGEAEGRHQNRGGWNQHRAWGNKREGIASWTKADKFQLEHRDYYQAAGESKRIYS